MTIAFVCRPLYYLIWGLTSYIAYRDLNLKYSKKSASRLRWKTGSRDCTIPWISIFINYHNISRGKLFYFITFFSNRHVYYFKLVIRVPAIFVILDLRSHRRKWWLFNKTSRSNSIVISNFVWQKFIYNNLSVFNFYSINPDKIMGLKFASLECNQIIFNDWLKLLNNENFI